MTAHVLGTRSKHDISLEKKQMTYANLANRTDDIETMKNSFDPDSEISNRPIKWNVEYSNSIRVNVEGPRRLNHCKTANTLEEELYSQSVCNRRNILEKTFFYCSFILHSNSNEAY